jgi:hypothetical protein
VGFKPGSLLPFPGSIAEAQEWELKIIAVQEWLTEQDMIITSHLVSTRSHRWVGPDFFRLGLGSGFLSLKIH